MKLREVILKKNWEGYRKGLETFAFYTFMRHS